MTFDLDESDRQMTILALAHLALERPGWDDALSRVADKMGGKPLFEEFKTLATAQLEIGETRSH